MVVEELIPNCFSLMHAVVVDVGCGDPQAAAVGIDDPRLGRHVDEPAAVIAEQVVRPRGERVRHAVFVTAFRTKDLSWLGLARAEGRVLGVPHEIVANVEVEVAIAVQIGEGGGGGPVAVAPQTGTLCDLLEGPVAPIAIQGVTAPAGEEEIRMASVVEIADRDAMAIPARQPGDA
jgi:hypothetical protein